MHVRRCAHLMFEPRESVQFDLDSIAAGGDGLRTELTLLALVPHRREETAVSAKEAALLAGIPSTTWTDYAALAAHHGAAVVQDLVARGLLICDAPEHAADRARDDRLRDANWHTLSAAQHYFGCWNGVRSGDENQRAGYLTLQDLIAKLGEPPPPVQTHAAAGSRLPLPSPQTTAFDALLQRRTTCRNFDADAVLTQHELATMLHRVFGAQGALRVTGGGDTTVIKRNSPSGGGLHPTGAYVIAQRVDALPCGLYHYEPLAHALEPLRALPPADAADLALRSVAAQAYFAAAPVLVVFAVRFPRNFWKYRNHAKAYRVTTLDVGHLSQTLYLSATDLGLGAFVTAAINEVEIEQAFGLDPLVESALAVSGFGRRAARRETPEFDPRGLVWRDDGSRMA
ncbi:MAG TPA: putative peptide maturation dehydrogenase [Tahibacter sp.]|uniref:putative peptide maturation dehydrogenase n=1 Tax=Tahibacter sp. TaxID=2056211 RepID=UPI002BAE7151|nr:putative peptide maturation dehydrogenase [Tahibacter sp.]HSX62113.1 putative peptide maturation dehydrogenase [Tahibacter sp.]